MGAVVMVEHERHSSHAIEVGAHNTLPFLRSCRFCTTPSSLFCSGNCILLYSQLVVGRISLQLAAVTNLEVAALVRIILVWV